MLHLKQGCFVREPKKNYIKKGYHHHSTNDVNRDGGKSENMKGESVGKVWQFGLSSFQKEGYKII